MKISPSFTARTLQDTVDFTHAAIVQGLTNFEVELDFNPDPVDDTHPILLGSGHDRQRGTWAIVRDGGGTRACTVQALIDFGACTSRARAIIATGALVITPGAWNHIILRVSGSADDGFITVQLQANGTVDPQRRTTPNNFNWLSGDFQKIRLGVHNLNGSYKVRDLFIRGEINAVMNIKRPDGVLVPRQEMTLGAGGRGGLTITTEPPDMPAGYPRLTLPDFTRHPLPGRHVAPFAKVVTSYCDTWDFDVETVPALSPEAISILRNATEASYGAIYGTGTGWAGFAGDLVAGMVFIGDIRDIIKNLCYLVPGGEDPDWINFTLAVIGLILDIGEIFSLGGDTPINALVAVIKVVLARMGRTGYAKRVAAFLGEMLIGLLRELRLKHLQFVQIGFAAWSMWPLVEDLFDFVAEGMSYRQLAMMSQVDLLAWLAGVAAPRIEAIYELAKNPVLRSKKDLKFAGGLLRRMQQSGIPDAEIARVIRELRAGGTFTSDTLRSLARVIAVKHRLNPEDITPRAVRGLAEYIRVHGGDKAVKLIGAYRRTGHFLDLLTKMDVAAKVARRVNAYPAAFKRITSGVAGHRAQRRGAFHELDVCCQYRHSIVEMQPLWHSKLGVDFVITRNGQRTLLECKAYYATLPASVKSLAAKIRKQFDRFKHHQHTGHTGHMASFAILYIFRGYYTPGLDYRRALREAVKACADILPVGFKLRRRDMLFLGQPAP